MMVMMVMVLRVDNDESCWCSRRKLDRDWLS